MAISTNPSTNPVRAGTSPDRRGWTGGRITALVAGSVLALISLALLAGGAAATWVTNTQRDAAGYLTTGTHSFSTSSYALISSKTDLGNSSYDSAFLGTVRIRVTPASPQTPVFVGIARTAAVSQFLAGVNYDEVTNFAKGTTVHHSGAEAPASSPAAAGIWTSQSSGTGTQTVTWKTAPGTWTVVVMNTTAGPGLAVTADAGITLPDLGWIAVGCLAGGGLLAVVAGGLILIPIRRAGGS